MIKKIGIIFIAGLLATGLYLFIQKQPQTGPSYEEKRAEITKEECKRRLEKQELLNGLTYSESIMYSQGKFTTEKLNEKEIQLRDAVSTIGNCTGINYHGVSFVPKVYAGTDTQEGIRAEIKKNSNYWDKLEIKRVRIVEIQTGLNKVNNNLRKDLPKTVTHKGFALDSPVQDYVNYAYKVGGMDLVKLIECEMGSRNYQGKGDGGKSSGLCQMHKGYHNIPDQFYTDWRFQIRYCKEKKDGGTKFYGPGRTTAQTNRMRCSDFVNDRFIIK